MDIYIKRSAKPKYNITPRPTRVHGVLYRSRLEAKWALMFKKLNWDFVYEPSQINGYNPDFLIKCNSKAYDCSNIIAEVKPSVFINDSYKQETYNKYHDVDAHIIILDDSPFFKHKDFDNLILGNGWQYGGDYNHYEESEFHMKPQFDCSSFEYMWDGMINGECHRKHFLSSRFNPDDYIDIIGMWNEAGNEVQFKVRRAL